MKKQIKGKLKRPAKALNSFTHKGKALFPFSFEGKGIKLDRQAALLAPGGMIENQRERKFQEIAR